MTDLRSWSHTFFTEFIELYRSFPCLWKVKDKDYSNRDKKRLAYEALVKKCKEIDPDANKDYVSKKVNSFRTVFRKEIKKIKESEKSGAGADDVYTPTLWYFPLLNFLHDQDTPRASVNTIEDLHREVSVKLQLFYLVGYNYTIYLILRNRLKFLDFYCLVLPRYSSFFNEVLSKIIPYYFSLFRNSSTFTSSKIMHTFWITSFSSL